MYILSLLIGIIVGVLGLEINSNIVAGECAPEVKSCNTGVIVVGAVMVTATVVAAYWSFNCKSGAASGKNLSKRMRITYYALILLLSIILTTLGAVMRNHVKECPKVKGKADAIMGIGIFGILTTVGIPAGVAAIRGGAYAKKKYGRNVLPEPEVSPGHEENFSPRSSSSMCGRKHSSA